MGPSDRRSHGVTINDKLISQKHILQFDRLQHPKFHNELKKIISYASKSDQSTVMRRLNELNIKTGEF